MRVWFRSSLVAFGALVLATSATTVVAAAPAPTVKPTNAYLYGVACGSARNCEAVGTWTFQSQLQELRPLAEHWNGTKWMVQKTPEPAGTTIASLNAVVCPGVKVCNAVGDYYINNVQTLPYVLHWNGSRWSMNAVKIPVGGSDGWLTALACPRSTLCVAVGYYVNKSQHVQNLAEVWNGSKWTMEAPADTSVTFNFLNGISCPRASSCFAVGEYTGSKSLNLPFAEHWNGRKWNPQPAPSPAGATAPLAGIACAAINRCLAVGDQTINTPVRTTDAVAIRWNGLKWTLTSPSQPSTAPNPSNVFAAIACASQSSCTAVGTYAGAIAAANVTLAEHWNGAKWRLVKTPNSPAKVGNQLRAIACAAASACVAVGYSQSSPDNTGFATLAERWNGVKWTIIPTPSPAG